MPPSKRSSGCQAPCLDREKSVVLCPREITTLEPSLRVPVSRSLGAHVMFAQGPCTAAGWMLRWELDAMRQRETQEQYTRPE